MILRIWRGWAAPEDADTYERFVGGEVLPGIAKRDLAGYHGAYLLRRETDGEVEFSTIMIFDSIESVGEFAGADYERSYVPDRAREILMRFDERSAHHEVLMTPDQTR
jgi:hypothetical protein